MRDFCEEIQRLGKGIGNANRYRILEELMKGPRTVSQLVAEIRLSQPAVSQHLKTLKLCKLVVDERHGQEVLYSLNVHYALGILQHFAANITKRKKARASAL